MNALELEFLEYQATPDDEFPTYFDEDDKPMRIDHIWYQISKQIDLYSGQPRFKHLAEFAKFLLLVPHSNLYCKSKFSTIRKIYTDGRHNLGKDATQGHASSSVYTENILIPKINIFGNKKLACYKWEPTKSILAQTKSATYKNHQARENMNNKQQLMRTQKIELLQLLL